MRPKKLLLLTALSLALVAATAFARDGDFPALFWDFSANNSLLWAGSGSSSDNAANAWTAVGDSFTANYSADSTSALTSYSTWACDSWSSQGVCMHWTASGGSSITQLYQTRTCTAWNNSKCTTWSGGNPTGIYSECSAWSCSNWSSSTRSCAEWTCDALVDGPLDYDYYNCTSFTDNACTAWQGINPRQTIGMHTFWACEGCTPRFVQNFQVIQGNAVVGQKVNWTVNVTGVGNGTCNYTSLPSDRLSVSLKNSSDGEENYFNSSTWISWNCNFSKSSYLIEFTTAAPAASEGAWIQDASKTSNLSIQFVKKTLQLTNPSSVNYSNVAWNTSCFQGFACVSTNGFTNVSSNSSTGIFVEASGDVLSESWENNFSQDFSKTTSAGGFAYAVKKLNVSNAASLNFSNVSTNWVAKPSWNCSALNALNFSAYENYSNNSFVACEKTNAVTKSEAGWLLDESYDNTFESQRLYNVLQGSNYEDIAFSNVFAAASIASPEGNLSAKSEVISFNDIAVAGGGSWARNATSTSDWINDSIRITRNGSWEWYELTAENVMNVSLTDIRGWIDFNDSFVKIHQQLAVNTSAGWINVTPFSTCPGQSSFAVEENGTNATWKTCSRDANGNGIIDRFEFIIPHFSAVVLQAGGRDLKSNGETCSQGSECSSGYCSSGLCIQPPSSGGGGGGGIVPNPTPKPTPSPTANENESEPPDSNFDSNASNQTDENATIDIKLPGKEVEVGYHVISVVSNGAPASGFVKITDPGGRVYVRELGPDGTLTFFFDKNGEWRIEYNNAAKTLKVTRLALPSPSTIPLHAASGATGMFVKASSIPGIIVLTAFFAALAAAAYFYRTRVRVRKKFEKGVVEIEATNKKKDLRNAVLLDIAPRGSAATSFSEKPLRKETIFGTALKWRRKLFDKGSTWRVKYRLETKGTRAKKLRQAELQASDARGKKVVACSNEIPLE